jgi:hypothetical protein
MTSKKDKHMPQNRSANTQQDNKFGNRSMPDPNDEDSIGSDVWNPTPKAFEAFLARDFALAINNVRMALTGSRPMTLRDLKESCLHSNDVIERVLSAKVANGTVKDDKGRYSLATA